MPIDIPRRACPRCGQPVPVHLETCPACGHAWGPEALRRKPDPHARKLLITLAIAVAVLLLSFCLLYAVLISFKTPPH